MKSSYSPLDSCARDKHNISASITWFSLMRVLILNGPNLNLLGTRQPDVYGTTTLKDVETMCRAHAPDDQLSFLQSNHEGALIDAIHGAKSTQDGIVLILRLLRLAKSLALARKAICSPSMHCARIWRNRYEQATRIS